MPTGRQVYGQGKFDLIRLITADRQTLYEHIIGDKKNFIINFSLR